MQLVIFSLALSALVDLTIEGTFLGNLHRCKSKRRRCTAFDPKWITDGLLICVDCGTGVHDVVRPKRLRHKRGRRVSSSR